MQKFFTCTILLFCCLWLKGNTIEIRYHVPQATGVTMTWGVNDWNIAANLPAGTLIKDKVMHTPMIKEGEDYVVKIDISIFL